MPASSTGGLSSITAALDSTFKHRKKSFHSSNSFVYSKPDSDDDDLAESWEDGILSNEVISNYLGYLNTSDENLVKMI